MIIDMVDANSSVSIIAWNVQVHGICPIIIQCRISYRNELKQTTLLAVVYLTLCQQVVHMCIHMPQLQVQEEAMMHQDMHHGACIMHLTLPRPPPPLAGGTICPPLIGRPAAARLLARACALTYLTPHALHSVLGPAWSTTHIIIHAPLLHPLCTLTVYTKSNLSTATDCSTDHAAASCGGQYLVDLHATVVSVLHHTPGKLSQHCWSCCPCGESFFHLHLSAGCPVAPSPQDY